MRHAVILAGGVGSRLWPISRSTAPKQFQKFTSDATLIQETYARIIKNVDEKNIWVVTTADYRDITKAQLPKVTDDHIIIEPSARNTAAAVGYATLKVLEADPEAIISCSPADHYVGKPDVFDKVFAKAYEFIEANPEFLAGIGINPTDPNTGYGYIQIGEQLTKDKELPIFKIAKFVEKPDLKTAQEYFESWDYLWNGGYFFFAGKDLIENYQQLSPTILDGLKKYVEDNDPETYKNIPSQPIDTAIAEKIEQFAVIPADLDWSDLGNWSTLYEIIKGKI